MTGERFAVLASETYRAGKLAPCPCCGGIADFVKTGGGNSIPCNAEELPYWQTKNGKHKIVTPNGEVLSAELEGLVGMQTGLGYVTHFATCPDAEKFRKKGKKEA